jgi:hypothetical protein
VPPDPLSAAGPLDRRHRVRARRRDTRRAERHPAAEGQPVAVARSARRLRSRRALRPPPRARPLGARCRRLRPVRLRRHPAVARRQRRRPLARVRVRVQAELPHDLAAPARARRCRRRLPDRSGPGHPPRARPGPAGPGACTLRQHPKTRHMPRSRTTASPVGARAAGAAPRRGVGAPAPGSVRRVKTREPSARSASNSTALTRRRRSARRPPVSRTPLNWCAAAAGWSSA